MLISHALHTKTPGIRAGHPILVFCATKANAESCARLLAQLRVCEAAAPAAAPGAPADAAARLPAAAGEFVGR